MIVFRITMSSIPTKQREMMQTLISMIEQTLMAAGCLSFAVLHDVVDKNRFSLLGEWRTREELDHHIASHQFGVLMGTKALLSEPADIQIYTVVHSEGMDSINKIRSGKISGFSPKDGQRSYMK